MNEELFVRRLAGLFRQSKDVFTGIGDDAAALDLGLPGGELLLAAADQVVEKIHFTPGTPPEKIAAKLLKRNLSDIAAMGGIPTHALVTVALNPFREETLDAFHRGLSDCADRANVSVIGGDSGALPEPGFTASLTILGRVRKECLCLRSNAAEGDLLYATGSFGNSFLSDWHLDFIPRLREAHYLAGNYTCAMTDVSDGLAKDAARMAAASGLAVTLDVSSVPLRAGATPEQALTEGEDYELIFAVPPKSAAEMEKHWPFPGIPLTRIGQFHAGTPGEIRGLPDGICRGYDHFHED